MIATYQFKKILIQLATAIYFTVVKTKPVSVLKTEAQPKQIIVHDFG